PNFIEAAPHAGGTATKFQRVTTGKVKPFRPSAGKARKNIRCVTSVINVFFWQNTTYFCKKSFRVTEERKNIYFVYYRIEG
ncbi:MAG: hypothetical protein LH472_12575, partial [Pyrinomonadaceae bacterium]|nr:hypothetical protein [Pyrinomonadaceae bacterium]